MKKTYKVVGAHRVLDHAPGEEFQATLPPDQEALLIEAGHIEVVVTKKEKEG